MSSCTGSSEKYSCAQWNVFPILAVSISEIDKLIWYLICCPNAQIVSATCSRCFHHFSFLKFQLDAFFLASCLSCFPTLRNFTLMDRWTCILGGHHSLLWPSMRKVYIKEHNKKTITFFSPCMTKKSKFIKWKAGSRRPSLHLWYAQRSPRKAWETHVHVDAQLAHSLISSFIWGNFINCLGLFSTS